ncbi:MAG: HEAT repeat domain-containing protein [Planctomycetota bacterium]
MNLFQPALVFLGLALAIPGNSTDSLDPAFVAHLRARYAAVERDLADADVSALTPDQLSARTRVLAALREYWTRGDFGHNHDFPGARVPHFVDHDGRHCAVAALLHATGEDELVEAVATANNQAWIVDLSRDERFSGWLARNGLTLWEAARIQVPAVGGQADPRVAFRNADTTRGSGGGGTYRGPGDTAGGNSGGSSTSAPASPSTPRSGESTGAPSSVAPAGSASTSPKMPGMPTALNLTTEADDGWWLWWEYNKLEFLRPNRLDGWLFPTTGEDDGGDRTRAVRRELLPMLMLALRSADAEVRGAAALALGRIGRAEAVDLLLSALSDASMVVRHRAILALGSTGSPHAIEPLLRIARAGAPAAEAKERVSPFASPLAIVALGLGRRAGFDASVDAMVARIASTRRGAERDAVLNAAFIYHKISPSPELEQLAVETALDSTQAPSVRCRAVESLSSSTDDRILSKLQTILSGPRLDLRRSAALALGDSKHPLALPPLMTAFETESEVLTKGFLLVSIGRQGGEKACDHLMRVLQSHETGMRKWAALGLGIAARRAGDEKIPEAIRGALAREKNREAAPAYWIALGLARDEVARTAIREGLWRASDPRMRMYAATALAMIGGDPSARALRERLPEESSSLARVAIAQSLGYLGMPEDSGALADVLEKLREPGLQGLAATAISFHGGVEDFHALSRIAKSDEGSPVRRASAIEGLGMLLGGSPPLVLGEASRQSNYTVFTDWVKEMLQTTL